MTNELTNTTTLLPATDGLDGYTDEIAGQEKKQGLFRGTRLKFSKTAEWQTTDDEEVIGSETRLILLDVARIVTKWLPNQKKPAETVKLGPREKIPDIEAWNNAAPRNEWSEKFGKQTGPWQFQHLVYLLDPKSMVQYTWADSTIGGAIAIRDVTDAVKAMRKFRPGACPVIELTDKFMPTNYGGKQRPHFIIQTWVGGVTSEEPAPAALPGPTTPTPSPAPTVTIQSKSFTLGDAVEPVTLQEEMNDEIPSFESPRENTLPAQASMAGERRIENPRRTEGAAKRRAKKTAHASP